MQIIIQNKFWNTNLLTSSPTKVGSYMYDLFFKNSIHLCGHEERHVRLVPNAICL